MKKLLIIVLVILVIITVVFYINKSNINTQSIQQSPDKVIQQGSDTVYILNFNFAPDIITINKGDPVVWVNQDQAIHDIKLGDTIISQQMGVGESFSHVFSESGEFNYACGIHPSMKGKVIVK